MANARLAYNPSPGSSGPGYSPVGPLSNIAIPATGWNGSVGGFAWWMSPSWNPVATGIIARLDADEEAPAGPWTWYLSDEQVPPQVPVGGMASNDGAFGPSTTNIWISEITYEGSANRIPNAMDALTKPYNILVRGVGPTEPFKVEFEVTAVNDLGIGVWDVSVNHVVGDSYTIIDGQAAAISTDSNASPEAYRSRGTFSFFEVSDITTDVEAAIMAVKLNIPGCTLSSTKAQIKTNAENSPNFWVSW
jgi:hypothetical protein